METVLRTEGLEKRFGPVRAVDGVSLAVERGEVFGFLGPNGAGKTTTIGMVLGLIHPTAGEVFLFGEPLTPARPGVLRRVGALVGATAALVPYLSARGNLRLVARLQGAKAAARIDEVLDLVGLREAADRKAGDFSTGMKQRLGLAMALLHQPDLLILDEPTNGMDPAGMREVRNMLRALADGGTTVFLSSHLLHEIQQSCDRVAVLNKGRVVAEGRVDELLDAGAVVKVRVADTQEAADCLRRLAGVQGVEPNGKWVTVTGRTSEDVVAHLVGHGIVPAEVTTPHDDLEDLYMRLTQEAV
ncbi:MAG: ABC transporter ATP-binding protein [Chloroflexi bacterium]|nr:ABC transporter ATP-binding protein [Chloroflexota bacterium]